MTSNSTGRITVRDALPGDIDQVLGVESGGASAWTRRQFEEELRHSFSCFLVAETAGTIAGFAVAWRVADEVQLNYIAVRTRFRRKGVGRLLVESLIAESLPLGSKKMLLEIRAGNDTGYLFYRSLGFCETGLRRQYYGDEDALLMEKTLC